MLPPNALRGSWNAQVFPCYEDNNGSCTEYMHFPLDQWDYLLAKVRKMLLDFLLGSPLRIIQNLRS